MSGVIECDSPWSKYQDKNPRGDFDFYDREGIGSVSIIEPIIHTTTSDTTTTNTTLDEELCSEPS